jgi:hypothetical protein
MIEFLKANRIKITLLLFLGLVMTAIAMRSFDASLKNGVAKNGVVSFELAKDLNHSLAILNSWDITAQVNAGLSLGLDFLFLLFYSSFIAFLIFWVNHKYWRGKRFYSFGRLLIGLVFCAALFDAIENIALIQLLLGSAKQIWSSMAYYFALAKFFILTLAVIYLLFHWGWSIIKRKDPTE